MPCFLFSSRYEDVRRRKKILKKEKTVASPEPKSLQRLILKRFSLYTADQFLTQNGRILNKIPGIYVCLHLFCTDSVFKRVEDGCRLPDGYVENCLEKHVFNIISLFDLICL
jgi:hypothetical protein